MAPAGHAGGSNYEAAGSPRRLFSSCGALRDSSHSSNSDTVSLLDDDADGPIVKQGDEHGSANTSKDRRRCGVLRVVV